MEVEEAVRRMGLAKTFRDRHWLRAVKVTDNVVPTAPPGWLEELLGALLRVEEPTYPMCYGFAAALRRLAAAPGRVEEVRRLAAAGLVWGEVRYRPAEVAEWLAAGQPEEHLMAVFEDAEASDELAACLLQETALRYDAGAAEAFARRLREAGHPLAALPLRRTAVELGQGPSDFAAPEGIAVGATEIEWPEAPVALGAHAGWEAEARLFRLERAVAEEEFGAALLRGLGLPSTASGLTGVQRAGAGDVWRTLFSGARMSMRGAYGRLASWRSLAALSGVQGKEFECLWLCYTSDWHLRVHAGMDAGIAALRPDRRTVAVLAATNSD